MNKTDTQVISYKIYWITWFVILCITFCSIAVDHIQIYQLRLILLLLLMTSKAALIMLNFMHLSHEKTALIITIIIGIVITSLILFSLISFDANPIRTSANI